MMNAAVSSSRVRPATRPSYTFATGSGATMATISSRLIPAAAARSAHCEELDRAGDDRAQLLILLTLPLELASVDDEHVDPAVAHRLLRPRECVPRCQPCDLALGWSPQARPA